MSIKEGDRVRVTFDGVAERQDAESAWRVTVDGEDISTRFAWLPERVLEKITPPLPTTPGSVVRDSDGVHWMLGRDGRWFGDHPGDKAMRVKAKHMTSPELGDLTHDVIFDLGAS